MEDILQVDCCDPTALSHQWADSGSSLCWGAWKSIFIYSLQGHWQMEAYLSTLQNIYCKQTYGFLPSLGPLLDWYYFPKADTIQRSSQLISGVPSKESTLCRLCWGEEGLRGRELGLPSAEILNSINSFCLLF